MPKKERFLPQCIGRFNYWNFEIAAPLPAHMLTCSTLQRLAEYPAIRWVDRPGRTAVHRQIQQDFRLLLTAPPEVWKTEVCPRLYGKIKNIVHRNYLAMKYYVEHVKVWKSDGEAQKVLDQLSSRQRAHLQRFSDSIWPGRSKQPDRIKRTWKALLQTIARDQERFYDFCVNPPKSGELSGTDHRIYRYYSRTAISLLGGGTFIPRARRKRYRDPLDEQDCHELGLKYVGRDLLDDKGRLPSKSIFPVMWHDLSKTEQRKWKKETLHWFQHALRNLHEYRYNRPPVPWAMTLECAKQCRRVQEKLCAL